MIAKGKLIYDPIRPGFRKEHKQRTLIVELPKDQMDLYYQWFITNKYGHNMDMQRPMYGLHCTVVKGNEFIAPDKLALWKKYSSQLIEIDYNPEKIERHWQFWSITVDSPKLVEIRRELGLRTDYRLHITIGRHYDWQT